MVRETQVVSAAMAAPAAPAMPATEAAETATANAGGIDNLIGAVSGNRQMAGRKSTYCGQNNGRRRQEEPDPAPALAAACVNRITTTNNRRKWRRLSAPPGRSPPRRAGPTVRRPSLPRRSGTAARRHAPPEAARGRGRGGRDTTGENPSHRSFAASAAYRRVACRMLPKSYTRMLYAAPPQTKISC